MTSAPSSGSFPVFLELSGRSALVTGGGERALYKVQLLAARGVPQSIVAASFDAGVEQALLALPAPSGLTIARRGFEPTDLNDVALVFAADEDEAAAAAVAAAAKAAGIPVNAPDRRHLSTFIMPAIVDRAPVTIAISSDGASPLLARILRQRIEAALPAAVGRLATFLQQLRGDARRLIASFDARRRFLERVAEGPIARRHMAGDERGAAAAAAAALHEAAAGKNVDTGSVTLVGAGPGDPDLLTLRGLRAIESAEVIVYDKLVDTRILDFARRDAKRLYVGKSKARHSLPQAEINAVLIAEARAGRRVVRLKGGDPFIFGRGAEEVAALRAAAVEVDVVPGLTAALGCGAATGIPMTHRELSSGVTFITGHGKDGEPKIDWAALARLDHTLVIYMGLTTLGTTVRRLLDGGLAAGTPAAVVERGTHADQRVLRGSLVELPGLVRAHGLQGPALAIVGRVAALADERLIENAIERLAS
jgi:uroporphyrin-III C-methyltransferase / precorrin-2 dehydrogenase / sirohydrochlorin ferrochelatase